MASHARCKCRIRFDDKHVLKTILEALKLETQKPPTFRSSANLKIEGDYLVLDVEAKDTVALRAALNAYLRWINSVKSVLDFLKSQ
jgi:tRNA threonylcarbamoyladenosine modification (KEOPS) complex  Pcc1 subunit